MTITDPYKKDISYTAGFFMLIAFGVAGMMFAGILGGGVFSLMTGKDAAELISAVGDPAYLKEMQIIQSLTAIFGFLIPTFVTASFLSSRPFQLVGFAKKTEAWQLMFTILIILSGLAVSSGLGYLSYQLPLTQSIKSLFDKWEKIYATQAVGMVRLESIPDLIVSIIVMALIPAICEEVFFRGGLQNFMYRGNKNAWVSVLVVSLIFSAVHMSGYGFLSRLALGIILGLIYQLSGNIWLSILAHFINNALAIIVMFSQVQAGKSAADAMSDKSGTYLGLLAIPVVILLFVYLNRKAKQIQPADGV